MAKQIGEIAVLGRVGNLVGYKTRRSSSIILRTQDPKQSERVRSSDLYANLRLTRDENAALFAANSEIYKAFPFGDYSLTGANTLTAINHVTRSYLDSVAAPIGQRSLGWQTYPAAKVAQEFSNHRKFDFISAAISEFSLQAELVDSGRGVRFGYTIHSTPQDHKEWKMYGVEMVKIGIRVLRLYPPTYNPTLQRFDPARVAFNDFGEDSIAPIIYNAKTYTHTSITRNCPMFVIFYMLPSKFADFGNSTIPLRSLCSFQIAGLNFHSQS